MAISYPQSRESREKPLARGPCPARIHTRERGSPRRAPAISPEPAEPVILTSLHACWPLRREVPGTQWATGAEMGRYLWTEYYLPVGTGHPHPHSTAYPYEPAENTVVWACRACICVAFGRGKQSPGPGQIGQIWPGLVVLFLNPWEIWVIQKEKGRFLSGECGSNWAELRRSKERGRMTASALHSFFSRLFLS